MSLKKQSNFWKWMKTRSSSYWTEVSETYENKCPDKLEPEYLPKTSVDKLRKKYGRSK